MSFQVEEFYNELNNGDVLLAYKGNITKDIIDNLLDQIEEKLNKKEESPKIIKKIYNVLVEGLQNLFHHTDYVPDEYKDNYGKSFGILVITKKDDGYNISFGNFVNEMQKGYLEEKIEKINSLTIDELKEMYKFILNHQKLSAKGGGGLGLLDMAKKTKKKLDYNFFEYKNNWYFYNLNLIVS